MDEFSKRILHVEDDAAMQEYILDVLDDLGKLTQVSNLDEASHLLQDESFDLVLLDFTLPDGSGQILLKQIESLNPTPAIIVLSGHELTKDIPGVNKVLTKGAF